MFTLKFNSISSIHRFKSISQFTLSTTTTNPSNVIINYNIPRPKILILSGPTASYKSYLSTILCDHLNGEIISADSVQVYKNLNIATDIIDFNYTFNANLYIQLCEIAINDIISRGKVPIFIGGSGFFLKCLLYGMNDYGQSDPIKKGEIELKIKELIPEDVEDENSEERWKTLLHLVSKNFNVPIEALSNVPNGDMYRLGRRIEILTSGQEFLPNKAIDLKNIDKLKYDYRCFFLAPPVDWHMRAMDYRAETFFINGLLDEVKTLKAEGLTTSMSAGSCIGYKQTLDYLDKKDFSDYSFKQLLYEVMASTRQFAKRQRSWFKGDELFEFLPFAPKNDSTFQPKEIAPHNFTKLPKYIESEILKRIFKSFKMNFDDYVKYRTDENMIKSQNILRSEKLTPEEDKKRMFYVPNYLLYPHLNNIKLNNKTIYF